MSQKVIRFGPLERGAGKAYLEVRAAVPKRGRVEATSTAKDGHELPAEVLSTTRPGRYILVVPLFRAEQVVSVRVRDRFGTVLGADTYRIGARVSNLSTSQGARRAKGLEDVRNIDRSPHVDAAWVQVDRLFNAGDGYDVVHGVVEAYVPEGAEAGELSMDVLDSLGQPAQPEPFILLEDEREPLEDGATLRTIHYSIKAPQALGVFVVWARFAGGAVRGGFEAVEPWAALRLRDAWTKIVDSSGSSPAYHDWFLTRGRASERELAVERGTELSATPTFSVVCPLFHTPVDVFDEMCDSVFAQTYPHWELVLVNATPEDEALAERLAERADDERVRVIVLEENLGIGGNTIAGIREATGDFVGLLDHDDVLTPDCLFRYAKGLIQRPETDLFYCDEDVFSGSHYSLGFFKPDYDHEFLCARDYVRHFLCLRRGLFDELDAEGLLPGPELDAAFGHALTLAVCERARNVFHVRRVLYHTRLHPPIAEAGSFRSKDAWERAELAAVQAHIDRVGLPARVCRDEWIGANQLTYVPDRTKTISLVVSVVPSQAERLAERLRLLKASVAPGTEIVLVDSTGTQAAAKGGTHAGTQTAAKGVSRVVGVEGLGWAAARNEGARAATGDILVFLDGTVEPLDDDWLDYLVGPLVRDPIAVVGAKLLYADDLIHHAGICIPKSAPRYVSHLMPNALPGEYGFFHTMHGTSAVSGQAMAISADDFWSQDGFDEVFTLGLADVDLCLRLREEARDIVLAPRSRMRIDVAARGGRVMPHARFGRPDSPDDPELCARLRQEEGIFMERWTDYLSNGDRYYNPNFLPEHCHYQIV